MVRARTFVVGLKGWHRWLLCASLGALATTALPPLHAIPVLLISFPALIWLIESSPRMRDALLAGWFFGFGHFVIGFYWLANAFLVDAARFAWLIPFAVLGLPVVLAVFTALAAAISWRVRLAGLAGVLVFALSWTAMEWVRGHVLTGFPWNLIGYSWAFSSEIIQVAAIFGVYGLSLMTVVVGGLPALWVNPWGLEGRAHQGFAAALIGVAVLAGAWGYGHSRLIAAPNNTSSGITIRVVQANVSQANKWRADRRESNFQRYLSLSESTDSQRPNVIVWPETAVPYFLSREVGRRNVIGDLVDDGGFVVTGAPRVSAAGEGTARIWNSVVAIDQNGAIAAAYDKYHLVPFGEYLPLRPILSAIGIDKLVYGPTDYSAGAGPETLHLGDLPPVGPMICYEAIFPGRVVDPRERPGWLLNVSNDGWYGLSAGPHQHFAMARLRSVEEGLPLVRAANTGISGIVDSFGRVVAKISLGESAVVDVELPQPVEITPIYGRYGDVVLLGLVLIMVVITFFLGVMTRTARSHWIP